MAEVDIEPHGSRINVLPVAPIHHEVRGEEFLQHFDFLLYLFGGAK